MRKLPAYLAFGFILITLFRVANFAWIRMHAGMLGVLFSIILGAGVFVSSYFTRDNMNRLQGGKLEAKDRNVKVWAWISLIFFVLVDMAFNMLEVWISVNPQIIDMQAAALLYGAFPTLAAGLFGALQGYVDRLPRNAKPANHEKMPAISSAIRRLLLAWINTRTKEIKQAKARAGKENESILQPPQVAKALPPLAGKRKQIFDLATRYPKINQTQIAEEMKLSRQRVGQVMQELEVAGYFLGKSRNGNGKVTH